jgi:putative adhesin
VLKNVLLGKELTQLAAYSSLQRSKYMKVQEKQITHREGQVEQRTRRNPWFAILLALLSIPLIIGGIGLLIFAGVTIAGVTLLVLTILLLVVGTSLLIAAGVFFVLSTVHVETRRFTVSEHPRIAVNNEVGTIHVNAGSDTNVVTIQTAHRTRRFGKAANKSWVRYEQVDEGNVVNARVDRVFVPGINLPQHIDFDITVPRNADLELTTNVGDIWVTGISGQMSLQSNTGSIYVRRGLLTGNSQLRTSLGSINFHEAIDPNGTYQLMTDTGSVNVTLPDDTAFELDASTTLGNVTTVVPGMTMTYRTDREVHGDAGLSPRASMTLRSSIGSVNVFEESDGHIPSWDENKSVTYRRGTTARSAVAGGLAGGLFFIGLTIAILSIPLGHFWTALLVTLALTSLVSSFSSSNARVIYGGFQGFVFFVGLAVCTVVGWWPWILVVFGVAAILGTLNGVWFTGNRSGQPKWL